MVGRARNAAKVTFVPSIEPEYREHIRAGWKNGSKALVALVPKSNGYWYIMCDTDTLARSLVLKARAVRIEGKKNVVKVNAGPNFDTQYLKATFLSAGVEVTFTNQPSY
jgi:hypothetical protein